MATLAESLEISREAGFFESASASAVELGRLTKEAGDTSAAESLYAEAIRMIELARCELPMVDSYRVGFSRNKSTAYEQLVDLLIDRGAVVEAFDVVQHAKSRALLELTATADIKPTAPLAGRFAELLADEAQALGTLAGMQARPGGHPDAEHQVAELDRVYAEMERHDPDYVSLRRVAPVTPAQLRDWLAAQGRPILLVDYFVTETRVAIFLLREEWTEPELAVAELSPAQLASRYAAFHRQVIKYRNAAGAGWTELSRFLTDPLRSHLRHGDLVYLIPHRALHALPIHALAVDGAPLAAQNAVAYAPAAGLLPLAQNPSKGTGKLDSCASFGIVFEDEAQRVADRFGDEPADTDGLTADKIVQACAGKDVCHFTCHGFFNLADPMSSGLIVGERRDERESYPSILTAREIMHMQLPLELICLSACQTAVSEATEGDEVLGLMRAFLYAGTSSIVASLWPVDAATTRELMCTFYDHLLHQYAESGIIDKAAALQVSQLDMMRKVTSRASFLWAPFVLIGDWR